MSDPANKKIDILTDEIVQKEETTNFDTTVIKEMAENGVMYGHRKARTQPRFKSFIFTTRNGIEIIDLPKTLQAIETVAEFFNKQIAEKKTVLLVGVQPSSWNAVESFAKKYGFAYIKNGWIGGLITNFKIIYQRLEHFRKLQKDMDKGELEKYTKKERVVIGRSIEKMRGMFEGLETMTKVPDVVFVIDTSIKNHMTALKEAKLSKIPVVAIIDSDDNPDLVDFPIPANDHSKMSIEWVMNNLANRLQSTDNSAK
ncbi:30S ribosomal protein S2 [Candidatus Wolfebacteria bacterium CG10_big_fil_rev_8_21_14_0_10_31_9]|uniref:Small ribosomal subunit protein uS2 n=1 Tax=Candidatus Wolfebacteria bacterium CG10_big_fil_rev_8_21_14_0_10_31_9 TaxID=1975070 RepID=A0A2H0RD22_9BACT|nr:MAG: 30S ribosomal protein S2 [Candidatus Wolfebacteria bacterium CG10_big_fil_rev_8_21_14_0_10_31_9]